MEQAYPGCHDKDTNCESWASSGEPLDGVVHVPLSSIHPHTLTGRPHPGPAGECERNPRFMLGTKEAPGQCIKSCGACAQYF